MKGCEIHEHDFAQNINFPREIEGSHEIHVFNSSSQKTTLTNK